MATTYNYSSYNSLIQDIQDEIDLSEISTIAPEAIQLYILQGCQRIALASPVPQSTDLRLLVGQSKYYFSDTTTPVTGTGTVNVSNLDVTGVTSAGTGTISTSGKDVTGVGTVFLSQLSVGRMIVVGTQKKMVVSITSNTVCTIDGSFDTDLSASAFNYSTTKFTKEINTGSTIIVGGVSRVVDTITDAYNLTVTVAYTAAQVGQTFTVDTLVTEIPTKFYHVKEVARVESGIPLPVSVVSNDFFQEYKQSEAGIVSHSNLEQPILFTIWNDISAHRYAEVYPTVEADKTITLFGFIQINPRAYASDALTANIPLTQEYEPAVKEFAKYRIYSKLKNQKEADISLALFSSYLSALTTNNPSKVRLHVDTA